MATKLFDLAVKTGTYNDKDGNEKGRYENVGSMWKGDNGEYLVLKRTFNPAGVPVKEGSDSIFISMFAPRDDNQAQQKPQQRKPKSDFSDMDDSAPF